MVLTILLGIFGSAALLGGIGLMTYAYLLRNPHGFFIVMVGLFIAAVGAGIVGYIQDKRPSGRR